MSLGGDTMVDVRVTAVGVRITMVDVRVTTVVGRSHCS